MNNNQQEINRLKALLSSHILDTPEESAFNQLAKLAAQICDSPLAAISFIDDQRQWFKAKVGIEEQEIPIQNSLCQFTIRQKGTMEVQDASLHPQAQNFPHVQAENGIRFYAGVPLTTPSGYNIGTLCVADIRAKELNEIQKEMLKILASQAMEMVNLQCKYQVLKNEIQQRIEDKVAAEKRKAKDSQKAYNQLYDALEKSGAIADFSPDRRISNANAIFCEMFGIQKEDLVGKPHKDFFTDEDLIQYEQLWDALSNGVSQAGKFRRVDSIGNTIWIQASYNPILDEMGAVVRVVKIAHDITGEIAAAKALEESKKLSDQLNVQKDYFIANISHEIRTPMQAIMGFTELLLGSESQSDRIVQLQAIKSASDNLLGIINDLLDLSKIESGIFSLEKEPFDLQEVTHHLHRIFKVKAEANQTLYQIHVGADVPHYLIGDKKRLVQILTNLLGNALKFTQKGKVELRISSKFLSDSKAMLNFEVQDSGIGIAKHNLQHIFGRFAQVEDKRNRKYGGTGLGLNISKLLVEIQGGTIEVQSEIGVGSTFSFEIIYDLAATPTAENTTAAFKTISLASKKILIGEDNVLNQELLKRILEAHDAEIVITGNGLEIIQELKNATFDLILMDIQMPEMDGFETTAFIRNELKLDLPIMALTAHSMMVEKNKILDAGANDYLSKPFTRKELIGKIIRWVGDLEQEVDGEEDQPDVASAPLLNLQYLEESCGNNIFFMAEMLKLFVDQAEKGKAELQTNLAQKNVDALAYQVHKLKSSMGVIGADLSKVRACEKVLKEKGDDPTLTRNIVSVIELISALQLAVNEVLQQYESLSHTTE